MNTKVLYNEFSFISHINNDKEYEKALDLLNSLIDDYDENEPLIDLLAVTIDRWENTSDEFKEFNKSIENMDVEIAKISVQKDQILSIDLMLEYRR